MFDKIAGQEGSKKTLASMLETGMIPHALLFTGPYGVGKSETAFELARLLLCDNGFSSGCNTCDSCKRAAKLEHPDLHLLFPFRIGSQSSWMEEFNESRKLLSSESYVPIVYEKNLQIVRELVDNVLEKLLESSFEGGRKVCIILNAERFNKTTANRMLKILEEPPEDVHFIMTAEQISMVLPTIVSRSSVLRFRRLRETEISSYLEEFSGLDKEKAKILARMAEGGIKTAKSLGSEEKRSFIESSFELYSKIALGKSEDAISQVSGFLWSRNVQEAEEILKGFAVCTRAVLQQKLNIKRSTNELFNKASELGKKTDLDSIDKLSKKIEEGMEMLGRNVNISSVMTYVFYGINEAYGK